MSNALDTSNGQPRRMIHITAGDDNWTPTASELQDLVQRFQAANVDPLNTTIVATREGVFAKLMEFDSVASESVSEFEKIQKGKSEQLACVGATYRFKNDSASGPIFKVSGHANQHEVHLPTLVLYMDMRDQARGLLTLDLHTWNTTTEVFQSSFTNE